MESKTPRMKMINPTISEKLSKILNDSYQAVQKAVRERQEEQKRESYFFRNQRFDLNYSAQVT